MLGRTRLYPREGRTWGASSQTGRRGPRRWGQRRRAGHSRSSPGWSQTSWPSSAPGSGGPPGTGLAGMQRSVGVKSITKDCRLPITRFPHTVSLNLSSYLQTWRKIRKRKWLKKLVPHQTCLGNRSHLQEHQIRGYSGSSNDLMGDLRVVRSSEIPIFLNQEYINCMQQKSLTQSIAIMGSRVTWFLSHLNPPNIFPERGMAKKNYIPLQNCTAAFLSLDAETFSPFPATVNRMYWTAVLWEKLKVRGRTFETRTGISLQFFRLAGMMIRIDVRTFKNMTTLGMLVYFIVLFSFWNSVGRTYAIDNVRNTILRAHACEEKIMYKRILES